MKVVTTDKCWHNEVSTFHSHVPDNNFRYYFKKYLDITLKIWIALQLGISSQFILEKKKKLNHPLIYNSHGCCFKNWDAKAPTNRGIFKQNWKNYLSFKLLSLKYLFYLFYLLLYISLYGNSINWIHFKLKHKIIIYIS